MNSKSRSARLKNTRGDKRILLHTRHIATRGKHTLTSTQPNTHNLPQAAPFRAPPSTPCVLYADTTVPVSSSLPPPLCPAPRFPSSPNSSPAAPKIRLRFGPSRRCPHARRAGRHQLTTVLRSNQMLGAPKDLPPCSDLGTRWVRRGVIAGCACLMCWLFVRFCEGREHDELVMLAAMSGLEALLLCIGRKGGI